MKFRKLSEEKPSEKERCLVYFLSSMKKNRFFCGDYSARDGYDRFWVTDTYQANEFASGAEFYWMPVSEIPLPLELIEAGNE